MADVEQPKSIPCRFDVAWVGECKKPSTNGWCSKHENQKCVSCKEQAVRGCEHTSGPFCCCAPLCKTCGHSLDGEGHVTREVWQKQLTDRKKEEKDKELSRTSSAQRMDETGLPLNLFELLKGNWKEEGFKLEKCFYLQLKHGLMGFFPAIVKEDKRMVITTDQSLLQELWKLLSPRSSKMDSFIGYVHEDKGVVYADSNKQWEQEESKPEKLLDRKTYTELVSKGDKPFGWAPGLIGSDMSEREFFETIESTAKQFA